MAGDRLPATGQRYGVARVCQVWDVPRSSFYAARQAAGRRRAPPKLACAPRTKARGLRRRPCSPPSRTTSRARPGPARGTGRSGPACA